MATKAQGPALLPASCTPRSDPRSSISSSPPASEGCPSIDVEHPRPTDEELWEAFSPGLRKLGFRLREQLGRGSFGVVYKCRKVACGTEVAVKVLTGSLVSQEQEIDMNRKLQLSLNGSGRRERAYFCLASHSFAVPTLSSSVSSCLVYPVLGPGVDHISEPAAGQSNDSRRDFVINLRHLSFQATEALAVLHEHGFCHSDFRPANVLLSHQGEKCENHELFRTRDENAIQIIDFGQTWRMKDGPPAHLSIPAIYGAPEVILNHVPHFHKMKRDKIDLWSLACVLFEMRFHQPLFTPSLHGNDHKAVQYLSVTLPLLGGPQSMVCLKGWGRLFGISKRKTLLKRHIVQCSSEIPLLEPSTQEAEDFADLLEQLLRWEPGERISARHALEHRWFSRSLSTS